MLDLYEVELNEETEKEKEKKFKIIRNIKRTLGKNRDFCHTTNNVKKGKKIGLRSAREEDVGRKEGIVCHNKKEVGKRLMHQNKEHFSKVKGSKAYKDKICANMIEDITREKILEGDLTREYCDE